MDVFHRLHNDSLQLVEGIITEQHAHLISNADEVKAAIRTAFGSYIEWLRVREAFLLKSVDRAMEAHLARSQTSLGDALSSLRVLQDSVGLLDCEGTGRDIKDQIEKLVRDMTSAMESDMKVTPIVRFEEKGHSALRSVIESCGEVFTETINVLSPPGKIVTSSKWSSWLQSPVNMEHMEEPELPYDFDDMGTMMSFAKMVQSPSSHTLVAETAPVGSTGQVNADEEALQRQRFEFDGHFRHLMATPIDHWLVAPPVALPPKKRQSTCPGEVGHCAHLDANLEIENLDQLKCRSPVAKDLQTWLMQPDVVPLPPVADICRAGQPCASLAQCATPSDHCISYFFTLSKRPEDWLTPIQEPTSQISLEDGHFSGKSSSCGDEFEVLSWSCSSQIGGRNVPVREIVRDDLKIWLKSTCPPLSDNEWLTDCCMESGCRSHLPLSTDKDIQQWLMKTA